MSDETSLNISNAAVLATVETLLSLAEAAWEAMENSEHSNDEETGQRFVIIPKDDYDAVCAWLAHLEVLPDDRPGYTLGPAGKARWALRGILPVPA